MGRARGTKIQTKMERAWGMNKDTDKDRESMGEEQRYKERAWGRKKDTDKDRESMGEEQRYRQR